MYTCEVCDGKFEISQLAQFDEFDDDPTMMCRLCKMVSYDEEGTWRG